MRLNSCRAHAPISPAVDPQVAQLRLAATAAATTTVPPLQPALLQQGATLLVAAALLPVAAMAAPWLPRPPPQLEVNAR